MKFANIIVDISLEKLDKTFQYKVPEEWEEVLAPGLQVVIPFGNRTLTGYVLELTDQAEFEEAKMKEILGLSEKAVPIESQLISLAAWMKDTYGCTMNQALKTVLPAKTRVKARSPRVEQTALPTKTAPPVSLNEAQRQAVEGICAAYPKPALLFGVTGSGKTEVYMELIARMQAQGKQTILLIPEISLTYQNLRRFYERFGDRVSVVNSRLSAGEKYEHFEQARQGKIDVMIGPRSALFTPFPHLGLILMDEEHEGAYRSETAPRYLASEVALERARLAGAGVVFGSATPSLETYTKALQKEYGLFSLPGRAKAGSALPMVSIVDLRVELREGNKSIFSRKLQGLMEDRLGKKEQVMLFLNRRGYAGFLSCRSCGAAIKCPHCDVALTSHRNGTLTCHYCGYREPMPDRCPACGSPYIAGFGIGTQKVEAMVHKQFPEARTLRMDLDTTGKKDSHSKLLSAFASGEADILIGTQMIVKGHDFPRVTLMGVLAADLSLYSNDFRAVERTFQLLTQAAGRAGRGADAGEVVIQTYSPENYGIQAAAKQDYFSFYDQEMAYRKLLAYPPAGAMLSVLVTSPKEEAAQAEAEEIAADIRTVFPDVAVIGPSEAGISRIQDIYRKMIYLKHPSRERLHQVRRREEALHGIHVQIDLL
ncbi:replication restart helicase PriA [Hominifimenecus sp. rT4P-3]|uniref:replication restart helicase PriA n=1 Tax=Hominifimenecus sp. rT4P-3 TaxID=3242979 RepID=UPI003DA38CEA